MDKKIKKPTQPYTLVFQYLSKKKRMPYLIKLLYHNTDSFQSYKFKDRLFLSYANTFFFLKNSFIYLQKIKFYKKSITSSIF